MNTTTADYIVLNGQKYPIRFGFKFQRFFMNWFKIEKISDYQKKILLITDLKTQTAFDVFAVLVLSAINAGSKEPIEMDLDDILDETMNDTKVMEKMMEVFERSQPKEDTPKDENPDAVGKPKKK